MATMTRLVGRDGCSSRRNRKEQAKVQTLIALARRRRDDEEGFTLIELMVVVLIIAILIAIAIPTFLGARERAQNRSAQSNVRNALTAEKTSYTDTQTYTATSATLTAIEPSLTYVTGVPAKGTHEVYTAVGQSTGGVAGDTVVLGAQSA